MSKTIEKTLNNNLCLCGCQEETKLGRRFKRGHNNRLKESLSNENYTIDSYGYIEIKKPSYFTSDKRGYIKEHIYIFQEYYKCCMLKWGIVHHKDEDKQNNSIENLEGMSRKQHKNYHFPKSDMSNRFCLFCHKDKTKLCKYTGCHMWFRYNSGFICRNCYRNKIKT